MASIPNNKEWRDFFETYKNLPSLWKLHPNNCQNNKSNKMKKLHDYNLLLANYRKIDPEANMTILKTKLHNVRFCYRRELKKMVMIGSTSPITDEDDFYEPKLWYFNRLNFLRDQMIIEIKKSLQMNNRIRHTNEIINIPYVQKDLINRESVSYLEEKPIEGVDIIRKQEISKNSNGSILQLDELQTQNSNSLNNMLEYVEQDDSLEDDINVYAVNWAVQFRNMIPMQKIYAKKAIEDILCLGQIEQLTLDSVQIPLQNSSNSFAQTENTNEPFLIYNAAENETWQE